MLTLYYVIISSGERGIRTPGTSRYGSFQDCCNRPLYHLSFNQGDWLRVQSECKGKGIFSIMQIFLGFFVQQMQII